jgi:hypothetical protein
VLRVLAQTAAGSRLQLTSPIEDRRTFGPAISGEYQLKFWGGNAGTCGGTEFLRVICRLTDVVKGVGGGLLHS